VTQISYKCSTHFYIINQFKTSALQWVVTFKCSIVAVCHDIPQQTSLSTSFVSAFSDRVCTILRVCHNRSWRTVSPETTSEVQSRFARSQNFPAENEEQRTARDVTCFKTARISFYVFISFVIREQCLSYWVCRTLFMVAKQQISFFGTSLTMSVYLSVWQLSNSVTSRETIDFTDTRYRVLAGLPIPFSQQLLQLLSYDKYYRD
jgi:hypothetical protein